MSRLLGIAFEPHEVANISAISGALGLGFDTVLVTGTVSDGFGAGKVFAVSASESPTADVLAASLLDLAKNYTHVAAVSSMQSKDVLARLAGLMDCGMITDAVAASSPTSFVRPIVAGSILATEDALELPVVLTFRPSGFAAAVPTGRAALEPMSLASGGSAKRVSKSSGGGSRPDLSQAKVVVSGGRPLKDSATFESVIGGLADALGGAVGATRAAVDSGIAPNELQVGQTGKVVAPDLYIAAGISGSTQHMAGIKDSKVIVAINKDPDAPIFEFADFGLVADLFEAIPEIRAKLGK